MSLNVSPDTEARLLALAQANGVSVDDFLKNIVEEKSAVADRFPESLSPELEPEEWVRRFRAWTRSHAGDDLPVLSDEAISRESIYGERGL